MSDLVDVACLDDDSFRSLAGAVVADSRFAGLGLVDVGTGVSAAVLSSGSLPKRLASVRDSLMKKPSGVRAFNVAASVVGAREFPIDGFEDLAEEFLTATRLEAAREVLPDPENSGLLVARMNVPVSREGVVSLWAHAAQKARGSLYRWDDRADYLSLFDADDLSGFDPEIKDDFPMAIVSTQYDIAREGDRDEQLVGLINLREDFPGVTIGAASLGDGAILAHRAEIKINRPSGSNSNECFVRQIESKPQLFAGVMSVPDGNVGNDGSAGVYRSRLENDVAARLLVR